MAQDPPDLGIEPWRIGAPVIGQIGKNHVQGLVRQRQAAHVCANKTDRTHQFRLPARLLQHGRGKIQPRHIGFSERFFQGRAAFPRPAAQVKDMDWLPLIEYRSRKQAPANFLFQGSMPVVDCCDPVKCGLNVITCGQWQFPLFVSAILGAQTRQSNREPRLEHRHREFPA